MKSLIDFWDRGVGKNAKHFIESMDPKKIEKMKNRVQKHLFNNLDFSQINTTIDWGCGGGLFAKELSRWSDIVLIDISQESLDKAKDNVKNVVSSQLVGELESFEYNGPCDLLFCHTVIHHFPSYDYLLKVLDVWQKIEPKFIAVHIKIGDKNKWFADKEYFKGKNCLSGLYLNDKQFVAELAKRGYKLNYQGIEKNYYENLVMKVGYLIFEHD